MRKYDIKNKRNIGIIIGISIIIIIMFSLVIKFFLSLSKEEYIVSKGNIVFDKDKTTIKLNSEGKIKTKWKGEYYLTYDGKDYELGNTALAFNEETTEIKLYGRYYEISSGSEINITSNETTIKNSLLTKFYKLADRKYLIIDKEIKSADNLLSTTDFLLVELDKAGNATLTNHKVNLKTFSETQIITSNYTFDIATEILTYGSDKIDLKKIIGSSNNYTKEDLIPDESKNINDNVTNIGTNGNNGNSTTDGNGGNNTGGNGNTTGGNSGNNTGGTTTIEEIKKAAKQTSVVSVTSTVNKIIIDYVIYDPYKEYTSVYMEVQKEDSDKVEVIYLNTNNTRYELKDILPNTKYNLKFKYTATEEGQTIIKEFSNTTISTQKPKLSLKVTGTRVGEITYVITTDNSYKLTKADLVVTIIDSKTGEARKKTISDVSIDSKEKIVKLDKMTDGDIIELKLINVKSEDTIIKGITASDKFIY